MQHNILLVDDDPVQLEIMSCILKEAGFENQILYSSPVHALQYARQHRPDILIVDYRMPIYTGAELSRMLLQQYPMLPTIIVTGVNDTLIGCEGYFVVRKGMINFFGQLVSHVQKALKRSNISSAAEISR